MAGKNYEDLVRIADELGKPILYQYELATGKEVPVFFVSDEKGYLFTACFLQNRLNSLPPGPFYS